MYASIDAQLAQLSRGPIVPKNLKCHGAVDVSDDEPMHQIAIATTKPIRAAIGRQVHDVTVRVLGVAERIHRASVHHALQRKLPRSICHVNP
jgi:hypothetical protein